jgi:hypothetical protein
MCLQWSNLVKISPSIDTLAKRYSDQRSAKDYIEYKIFLVVLFNYFHYTKKTNEGIDYFSNELEGRYENLVRSINHFGLVSHYPYHIPQIFSFISWNYDFQLEQTIERDKKQNIINHSLPKQYENTLGVEIKNLNGSSFIPEESLELGVEGSVSILEMMINIYVKLKNAPKTNPLKFAWEPDESPHNVKYLQYHAKETKYVVVIGYSFPTFNRDVDNAFFHNLKPGTKVFTQGYDYADSQRIERYLRQIFSKEPFHLTITPVESPYFYVPAEYFLEKEKVGFKHIGGSIKNLK